MTTLPRTKGRPAFAIFGATLVASALVGVVWGLLAPPVHLFVLAPGRGVSLTGESVHRFDAIGLFACAGLVVGVLTAVAAWAVRRNRGPAGFGALLLGSVLGAGAMALTGIGVASLRVPDPGTSNPGTIVATVPGIGTLLVLIFQPLAACVVTLILAVLNPYDDLGVAGPSPSPVDSPVDSEQPDEVEPADVPVATPRTHT